MRQTTKPLYNQKVRSLFTQLICETELLYEEVVAKTYSITARDIQNAEPKSLAIDYQKMTVTR